MDKSKFTNIDNKDKGKLKAISCRVQKLGADGEWMSSFSVDDLDEAKKNAQDYSKMHFSVYRVLHHDSPICVYINGELLR